MECQQLPQQRKLQKYAALQAIIYSTVWKLSLLSLIIFSIPKIEALTCNDTLTCEKFIREGSKCIDGSCSNPFVSGCLRYHMGEEEFPRTRICNSHDPNELLGNICTPPDFDYLEIRLWGQNWESAMFTAWIMQIFLSEMLNVPSSIETLDPAKSLNFYDPQNAFNYPSTGYDWEGLASAARFGDCQNANVLTGEEYTPCSHVFPEVWTGAKKKYEELEKSGIIESPSASGLLGRMSWFVPKFTAKRDPSLTSYMGLTGKGNRRKLAKTFKRPTTWKDYCDLVSWNRCKSDDGVAVRSPENEAEEGRYFVDGLFKGYFRATEKNDCEKYPTNCTGHITNVPCGWTTYAKAQAYHLDISVESDGPDEANGGYGYQSLIDIWAAANATKTDVLVYYYWPEPNYQAYVGTDAEFVPVTFPAPSQECVTSRVTEEQRCSAKLSDQLGSAVGACDTESFIPLKIFSSNLYNDMLPASKNDAERNPGYDALKVLRISDLQIGQIFDYWRNQTKETYWDYGPRDAVCQWVVENRDYLESFIPRSYPRKKVIREEEHQSPFFYSAFGLGIVMSVLAIKTVFAMYHFRDRPAIRTAQLGFLNMLLVGLVLVSLGAMVMAMPPNDTSCVVRVWLTQIGYTLELFPLTIKVAAVNKMMQAAKKMKRVKITQTELYGYVVVVIGFVIAYLITWTVLDPPEKESEMQLTDEITDKGETKVYVSYYCGSSSDLWLMGGLIWQCILLLCATVLAYQTRGVRADFNESQTMGFMIYSHFMFILMRVVTYLLDGIIMRSTLEGCRSIIYSLDAFVSLIVYFFPKLHKAHKYKKSSKNSYGVSEFISNVSQVHQHITMVESKSNLAHPTSFQGSSGRNQGIDYATKDNHHQLKQIKEAAPICLEESIDNDAIISDDHSENRIISAMIQAEMKGDSMKSDNNQIMKIKTNDYNNCSTKNNDERTERSKEDMSPQQHDDICTNTSNSTPEELEEKTTMMAGITTHHENLKPPIHELNQTDNHFSEGSYNSQYSDEQQSQEDEELYFK